jgi:hypothetical protein
MKKILFLAVIIILSSCASQRRCNRKFPPTEYTHIKDSTVISTYYVKRDTTIYQIVEVPNFVSHDSTVITYINGVANIKPLFLKGNYSTANVWLYGGLLKGELSEGGFMPVRVKVVMQDKYIKELKSKSSETTKVIQVKFIPKFVKFLAWFGGIIIILIILYIAYKVAKVYFKFSMPFLPIPK